MCDHEWHKGYPYGCPPFTLSYCLKCQEVHEDWPKDCCVKCCNMISHDKCSCSILFPDWPLDVEEGSLINNSKFRLINPENY
jgi:hypothetical protein